MINAFHLRVVNAKALPKILHSQVHFRYLPFPSRQPRGDILVPRRWNLKIIEKSCGVGFVEDGGDTVKEEAVWAERGDELTDGRYAG